MILAGLTKSAQKQNINRIAVKKTGFKIATILDYKKNPSLKFLKKFGSLNSFAEGTEHDPKIQAQAIEYFRRQKKKKNRESEISSILEQMELENLPSKTRKLSQRLYVLRNPEKRASSQKKFQNKTENRITHNLRTRLRKLVTKGIRLKQGDFKSVVGCSRESFFRHIEMFFEDNMSWENYGDGEGKWSLDHIIPLSYYNEVWDSGDQKRIIQTAKYVNNYTNLMPLMDIENKTKRDRYPAWIEVRGDDYLWSNLHEEAYFKRGVYFESREDWAESMRCEDENFRLMQKHQGKTS
jgi:hypothetical protein